MFYLIYKFVVVAIVLIDYYVIANDKSIRNELDTCMDIIGVTNKQLYIDKLMINMHVRDLNMDNMTLSFIHIPKNGGSTVTDMFSNGWRNRGCTEWEFQSYMVDDEELRPGALSSGVGCTEGCQFLHFTSGRVKYGSVLKLLHDIRHHSSVKCNNHVAGIMGHMPFGSCTLFDNCQYSTVLREPMSRFVSHVKWECTHKHPHLNCSDVETYAADPAHQFYGMYNHQVRMLMGDGFEGEIGVPCVKGSANCDYTPHEAITKEHLERAVYNMASYMPVWGHLDDLDDYFERIKPVYHMEHSKLIHRNPSAVPSSGDILHPSIIKFLEDKLKYDIALYKWSSCVLNVIKTVK